MDILDLIRSRDVHIQAKKGILTRRGEPLVKTCGPSTIEICTGVRLPAGEYNRIESHGGSFDGDVHRIARDAGYIIDNKSPFGLRNLLNQGVTPDEEMREQLRHDIARLAGSVVKGRTVVLIKDDEYKPNTSHIFGLCGHNGQAALVDVASREALILDNAHDVAKVIKKGWCQKLVFILNKK